MGVKLFLLAVVVLLFSCGAPEDPFEGTKPAGLPTEIVIEEELPDVGKGKLMRIRKDHRSIFQYELFDAVEDEVAEVEKACPDIIDVAELINARVSLVFGKASPDGRTSRPLYSVGISPVPGTTCYYAIPLPPAQMCISGVSLQVKEGEQLHETVLALIFGEWEKTGIDASEFYLQYPAYAINVAFLEGLSEPFARLKIAVFLASLVGLAGVLGWRAIQEKRHRGEIDPLGFVRSNAVFLLAAIYFTFPIGTTTLAWETIKFVTRVGDEMGDLLGSIFVRGYLKVQEQNLKAELAQKVLLDKKEAMDRVHDIRTLAFYYKFFCCANLGDEARKKCESIADDIYDYSSGIIADTSEELQILTACIGGSPEKIESILGAGTGVSTASAEQIRKKARELSAISSSLPPSAPSMCLPGKEDSIVNYLLSEGSNTAETLKIKKEEFSRLAEAVEEIKRGVREHYYSLGWLSVPLLDVLYLGILLDSHADSLPQIQQVKEQKEESIEKFAYTIIKNLILLSLPPFSMAYPIVDSVVEKLADKVALVSLFLPSGVSKVGGALWFVMKMVGVPVQKVISIYLTIQLGMFLLSFLATAALVIGFYFKYIFYLVEIIKHFYTSPFNVIWAIDERNYGRLGAWFMKVIVLAFYPPMLVIAVQITVFVTGLIQNVLDGVAFYMMFGDSTPVGGMVDEATLWFKRATYASLITYMGLIAKIYYSWTIVTGLVDWFLEQVNTHARPVAERFSQDVIGRLRGRLEV